MQHCVCVCVCVRYVTVFEKIKTYSTLPTYLYTEMWIRAPQISPTSWRNGRNWKLKLCYIRVAEKLCFVMPFAVNLFLISILLIALFQTSLKSTNVIKADTQTSNRFYTEVFLLCCQVSYLFHLGSIFKSFKITNIFTPLLANSL